MEGDRKYKQHGYQDSGSSDRRDSRSDSDRPRPSGPKPALDVTGPRLPRLVQSVTASRCFNCATQLPGDIDVNGACPKCQAALHCCKQCAHFEPSTRFQCLKPIPVRIAVKDKANECSLFRLRVTVARDASASSSGVPASQPPSAQNAPAPRNASDARSAFDRLFKK